jgi:hypothetical protein
MQATLWLVLGATVGLAALVNHERRRSMRVELGPPTAHGWLSVRMPRTWQPVPAAAPNGDRDGRIIARAVEPDEQLLGRTITITRDRVARPVSPLEFLLSSNNQILGLDLLLANSGRGARQQQDLVEPITVGGWPGVLVRGVRAAGRGANGAPGLPHKEIYAATVLPSGHAIVVKLEGDRPAELSDVEIVKQLAGSIEIAAQPSLGQAGEVVALDGGIRVAVPEGFRPVYDNDPNLLSRRLWPDGDATRWSAAELVPCVLAPAENNDETTAIKALAAVQDPALRDATVTPDGPRRWRIARSGIGGAGAPGASGARAYVVADELGDAGAITGASPRRALLALFYTAGPADDPAAAAATDGAWDALARSVSFVGQTDFGSLLDAGRDEAERIRKETLANLLPASGEQWWLWSDEQERRNLGWSRTKWQMNRRNDPQTPKVSEGKTESVFHPSGGGQVRSVTTWEGELRRYKAWTHVTASDPASEAVDRHVALAGEKLSITLNARGRPVASGAGAEPAQFVPGVWLPMLIGKLSPNAMLLKADAFLAREPVGAPMPMLLIVQPVAEQPAPVDGDGAPLRCVSVRVNGSGEASRWYVRPNGDVIRVTFARGVQRRPSDRQTVWFTFPADMPGQ